MHIMLKMPYTKVIRRAVNAINESGELERGTDSRKPLWFSFCAPPSAVGRRL